MPRDDQYNNSLMRARLFEQDEAYQGVMDFQGKQYERLKEEARQAVAAGDITGDDYKKWMENDNRNSVQEFFGFTPKGRTGGTLETIGDVLSIGTFATNYLMSGMMGYALGDEGTGINIGNFSIGFSPGSARWGEYTADYVKRFGVEDYIGPWGSLAADILLDPTLYLTLGTGTGARVAVQEGSKLASTAGKFLKGFKGGELTMSRFGVELYRRAAAEKMPALLESARKAARATGGKAVYKTSALAEELSGKHQNDIIEHMITNFDRLKSEYLTSGFRAEKYAANSKLRNAAVAVSNAARKVAPVVPGTDAFMDKVIRNKGVHKAARKLAWTVDDLFLETSSVLNKDRGVDNLFGAAKKAWGFGDVMASLAQVPAIVRPVEETLDAFARGWDADPQYMAMRRQWSEWKAAEVAKSDAAYGKHFEKLTEQERQLVTMYVERGEATRLGDGPNLDLYSPNVEAAAKSFMSEMDAIAAREREFGIEIGTLKDYVTHINVNPEARSIIMGIAARNPASAEKASTLNRFTQQRMIASLYGTDGLISDGMWETDALRVLSFRQRASLDMIANTRIMDEIRTNFGAAEAYIEHVRQSAVKPTVVEAMMQRARHAREVIVYDRPVVMIEEGRSAKLGFDGSHAKTKSLLSEYVKPVMERDAAKVSEYGLYHIDDTTGGRLPNKIKVGKVGRNGYRVGGGRLTYDNGAGTVEHTVDEVLSAFEDKTDPFWRTLGNSYKGFLSTAVSLNSYTLKHLDIRAKHLTEKYDTILDAARSILDEKEFAKLERSLAQLEASLDGDKVKRRMVPALPKEWEDMAKITRYRIGDYTDDLPVTEQSRRNILISAARVGFTHDQVAELTEALFGRRSLNNHYEAETLISVLEGKVLQDKNVFPTPLDVCVDLELPVRPGVDPYLPAELEKGSAVAMTPGRVFYSRNRLATGGGWPAFDPEEPSAALGKDIEELGVSETIRVNDKQADPVIDIDSPLYGKNPDLFRKVTNMVDADVSAAAFKGRSASMANHAAFSHLIDGEDIVFDPNRGFEWENFIKYFQDSENAMSTFVSDALSGSTMQYGKSGKIANNYPGLDQQVVWDKIQDYLSSYRKVMSSGMAGDYVEESYYFAGRLSNEMSELIKEANITGAGIDPEKVMPNEGTIAKMFEVEAIKMLASNEIPRGGGTHITSEFASKVVDEVYDSVYGGSFLKGGTLEDVRPSFSFVDDLENGANASVSVDDAGKVSIKFRVPSTIEDVGVIIQDLHHEMGHVIVEASYGYMGGHRDMAPIRSEIIQLLSDRADILRNYGYEDDRAIKEVTEFFDKVSSLPSGASRHELPAVPLIIHEILAERFSELRLAEGKGDGGFISKLYSKLSSILNDAFAFLTGRKYIKVDKYLEDSFRLVRGSQSEDLAYTRLNKGFESRRTVNQKVGDIVRDELTATVDLAGRRAEFESKNLALANANEELARVAAAGGDTTKLRETIAKLQSESAKLNDRPTPAMLREARLQLKNLSESTKAAEKAAIEGGSEELKKLNAERASMKSKLPSEADRAELKAARTKLANLRKQRLKSDEDRDAIEALQETVRELAEKLKYTPDEKEKLKALRQARKNAKTAYMPTKEQLDKETAAIELRNKAKDRLREQRKSESPALQALRQERANVKQQIKVIYDANDPLTQEMKEARKGLREAARKVPAEYRVAVADIDVKIKNLKAERLNVKEGRELTVLEAEIAKLKEQRKAIVDRYTTEEVKSLREKLRKAAEQNKDIDTKEKLHEQIQALRNKIKVQMLNDGESWDAWKSHKIARDNLKNLREGMRTKQNKAAWEAAIKAVADYEESLKSARAGVKNDIKTARAARDAAIDSTKNPALKVAIGEAKASVESIEKMIADKTGGLKELKKSLSENSKKLRALMPKDVKEAKRAVKKLRAQLEMNRSRIAADFGADAASHGILNRLRAEAKKLEDAGDTAGVRDVYEQIKGIENEIVIKRALIDVHFAAAERRLALATNGEKSADYKKANENFKKAADKLIKKESILNEPHTEAYLRGITDEAAKAKAKKRVKTRSYVKKVAKKYVKEGVDIYKMSTLPNMKRVSRNAEKVIRPNVVGKEPVGPMSEYLVFGKSEVEDLRQPKKTLGSKATNLKISGAANPAYESEVARLTEENAGLTKQLEVADESLKAKIQGMIEENNAKIKRYTKDDIGLAASSDVSRIESEIARLTKEADEARLYSDPNVVEAKTRAIFDQISQLKLEMERAKNPRRMRMLEVENINRQLESVRDPEAAAELAARRQELLSAVDAEQPTIYGTNARTYTHRVYLPAGIVKDIRQVERLMQNPVTNKALTNILKAVDGVSSFFKNNLMGPVAGFYGRNLQSAAIMAHAVGGIAMLQHTDLFVDVYANMLRNFAGVAVHDSLGNGGRVVRSVTGRATTVDEIVAEAAKRGILTTTIASEHAITSAPLSGMANMEHWLRRAGNGVVGAAYGSAGGGMAGNVAGGGGEDSTAWGALAGAVAGAFIGGRKVRGSKTAEKFTDKIMLYADKATAEMHGGYRNFFRAGELVTEQPFRMMLFVNGFMETGSFNEAARVVHQNMGDTGSLSNFERNFMRRAFGFYSWMKTAIKHVVSYDARMGQKALYHKIVNDFNTANGTDKQSDKPGWVENRLALIWKNSSSKYGRDILVSPGTPIEDVANMLNAFTSRENFLKEAMARGPIGAGPIGEWITNQDTLTGREVSAASDANQWKDAPFWLKKLVGYEDKTKDKRAVLTRPSVAALLDSVPLTSRYIAVAKSIYDSDNPDEINYRKIASQVLGVSVLRHDVRTGKILVNEQKLSSMTNLLISVGRLKKSEITSDYEKEGRKTK